LAWPVLAIEQAEHLPVHVPSQQKPSTQLPVAHWFAAVQAVPVVFLAAQVVPEQ
jgi:hypothetical protein